MPFGLTNAPITFQSYVNEALYRYTDVFYISYMDDILIYSNSEAEYVKYVKVVLQRLQEFGLYIKLSKCKFHVKGVDFLRFRVDIDGVSMDKSRVQTIQEWPVPSSFREIQVFLGFTNFYRGFVRNILLGHSPHDEPAKGYTKRQEVGAV